jgi:branched-chain amino acid transport system substrate-binding protein
MEKRCVKIMFLIGLGLLLTVPVSAQDLRGITSDTVKVGLIADTTGPVADFGRYLVNGYVDLFKYYNEKGGIHGRKIELVHEDDQYKIPLAIAAFEKLVFKENVLGLLHLGGSAQAMALMPKVEKEKVPSIPSGVLEPMYTPYKRYFFIYGSRYTSQIEVCVDYVVNDLKVKSPKMGFVYWPLEWGKDMLKAGTQRLKAYGVESVGEVELPIGTVDPSSQVLAMKKAGADYVAIFCLGNAAINFIKTAEKFNYFPTYLTSTWCADDSVIKAVGSAGKNYYSGSIFGSWHEDSPGGKEVREMAKKYGSDPKLPSLYIQGYTTGMIFLEGLKRAGRDLTVEKFTDALETLKEFDCNGMLCPMTYTPQAHNPSEYTKIFKADVEKQILVPATGWVKPRVLK